MDALIQVAKLWELKAQGNARIQSRSQSMESDSRTPRTGERRTWMPYDAYPDFIWQYTHLNEPQLTAKFEELSAWGTFGDTDYATLQPSMNPAEASQDRHVVQDWEIDGKIWHFRGVFDGHGGHDTADYTVRALPTLILGKLAGLVRINSNWRASDVSQLLVNTIVDFDNAIGSTFVNLFPGNSIHDASDEELQTIVTNPANLQAILRCMRGTTALVALVDSDGTNLWVASLGDCTAILGTKEPNGTWSTKTLSHNHNGGNPSESVRVLLEHHGEQNCVENDRILGAIAVTRAIGDFVFKLPSIYTQRVLLNCEEGFRLSPKVEEMLPRIVSPPYVSNVPQVSHTALRKNRSNNRPESFGYSPPSYALLLFSDGLGDLYEDEFRDAATTHGFWSYMFGQVMSESRSDRNVALSFIRAGLGGSNPVRVSRLLTTEYEGRWMDDTTVLVQQL